MNKGTNPVNRCPEVDVSMKHSAFLISRVICFLVSTTDSFHDTLPVCLKPVACQKRFVVSTLVRRCAVKKTAVGADTAIGLAHMGIYFFPRQRTIALGELSAAIAAIRWLGCVLCILPWTRHFSLQDRSWGELALDTPLWAADGSARSSHNKKYLETH